jgi:hypothetical protein
MTKRRQKERRNQRLIDAATEQRECQRIVRAGIDDRFGATSSSTVASGAERCHSDGVELADAGELRDYPSMC